MKFNKEYEKIRDNISLGIAVMGEIFDESGEKEKFHDVFDYVVNQLEELDVLWDIRNLFDEIEK